MFGRKGGSDQEDNQIETIGGTDSGMAERAEVAPYASPVKAINEAVAPAPHRVAAPAAPVARRVIDIPSRRSVYQETGNQQDVRRLTVGREITLTGEIATCDVLVVEGNVNATLRDGRLIEIAEAGMFQGTVEIDNADIAGKFEGDLIVHNRLTVRATGQITGRVQYGELEILAGGRITGEIQSVSQNMAQAQSFRETTNKLASTFDDDHHAQHDMLGKKERA